MAVHGQDVERCVVEIVTRGHCEGAAASGCASVLAFGVEGGGKTFEEGERKRNVDGEGESRGEGSAAGSKMQPEMATEAHKHWHLSSQFAPAFKTRLTVSVSHSLHASNSCDVSFFRADFRMAIRMALKAGFGFPVSSIAVLLLSSSTVTSTPSLRRRCAMRTHCKEKCASRKIRV